MNKKIIALCLIFLFLITPCFATEAYEFAKSYINGLTLLVINQEKAEVEALRNDTSDAGTGFIRMFSELRQSIQRLKNAKVYIEPYLNSQNKYIKEAAAVIMITYDYKIKVSDQMLKLYEDMVSKPQEFDEGKFVVGSGKLDADNEEAWNLLNNCSVLMTYCLVDPKPDKNGKLSYLLITSAERKDLIKDIDNLYGDSVKNGLKVGQNKLQVCGSLIKQVLIGEHKSADERKE